MHLDVTPEVLIAQLELGSGEATLKQTQKAIESTKEFDKFAKHIISLNDKLKHMNAYIALSNTEPCLKIKCDSANDSEEVIAEFTQTIKTWAEKYHVELKKVDNKDVYYIVGRV
jgi:hypothetical protein